MNVFLTSDQHFFHQNIIKYCHRPFELSLDGVIANAEMMYNRYNSVVKNGDVVIFLGDVAFLNNKNKKIFGDMFKTMLGHKILIRGNHDAANDDYYKSIGFEVVTDHIVLGRYFLCHYPLYKDNGIVFSHEEKNLLNLFKHFKCDTIIHGHIHDKESPTLDKIHRLNVCVDYKDNDFYPVKFNKRIFTSFFKNYLKKREEGTIDEDCEYSFLYSKDKLKNIIIPEETNDKILVTKTKREGRSEAVSKAS